MNFSAVIAPAAHRLLSGLRCCVPGHVVRWSARFSREQRQAFEAETRGCGEALLQFGRTSDEEFTALARGLGQLNENLAALRQHNADFLLVLEGGDADRPIASAQEVYKRSVDLVHSSIGIATSEQEQMRGIEQALLAACSASDQFQRNQLLLRLITMNFRMEAARMEPEHQTVFFNVGDAIGDISRKMSASTEVAFERIAGVIAETRAERKQLNDIEIALYERSQSSMRLIQRELTALEKSLAPCAEQGRGIAEIFARTGALTLRTLASLQHQDIVRQQLEHVAAGFSDLQEHLGETSGADSRLELGYIHHAVGVQQAHLQAARHEIEQAADEVVGGLQGLLEASTALADRFGAMEKAASAAFADFRIVAMFREEIGQLARVADKSKEANRNISRLVTRIEEVVRVFAEEVGHHELDVKIVALNAQIASARVPSADALSRLAEETCRVSLNNTTVTRQLLTDLQGGLVQLREMKASADQFLSIVTDEKSELEKGVTDVTGKLTRFSTQVVANATRVRRDFAVAHKSTVALLDQLGLTGLIGQMFPRAEALCRRLLLASSSHSDRELLTERAEARLEAHRDRYTMQKENAMHATVLTSSRPVTVQTAEDVEFFVDDPAGHRNADAPVAEVKAKTPRTLLLAAHSVPARAEAEIATGAAQQPPPPATAQDLGDGIELF